MKISRVPAAVLAVCATTILGLAVAVPAYAAPPANDTYAGRVVVAGIPFAASVDTTEATTDADDAELNAQCGAPATDASVWYELTAASDGALVVDVSNSTYSAGVLVGTGSPGSFNIVACAPGAVAFGTSAGTTYAILAIDDQFDGGGNGGTLQIAIEEIPPPPTIDIAVDPFGSFDSRTGAATIRGTATCTGDVQFASVDVQLTQRVGRFLIRGFGFTEITCDGTTRPWEVTVTGDNGMFKGGRAVSVTFAFACGVFDCGFDFEERIVRLRR